VEPTVIAKGSPVTAEYTSGAIRLKVPVIAERAGRVGDLIQVRNPSSQKVFSARVRNEEYVVVEENLRTKP
jgi:flagella basal body P-ring formation protein FlgA